MIFKTIKNKKKYLKKNYPFAPVPKLNDQFSCLHCGRTFFVREYKVIIDKSDHYIVCPNAPVCKGTVVDWVSSDHS